jgi:hypothetical protein
MLPSFHCRLGADEESLISFVPALAGLRDFLVAGLQKIIRLLPEVL